MDCCYVLRHTGEGHDLYAGRFTVLKILEEKWKTIVFLIDINRNAGDQSVGRPITRRFTYFAIFVALPYDPAQHPWNRYHSIFIDLDKDQGS
jgi:hypothetical protein